MRWTLALVAVCSFSCGGDESPSDLLQGSWIVEANQSCTVGVTFKGSVYESDFVCTLASGRIGLEAEVGTFTATRDTITVKLAHATCDGVKVDDRFGYSIEGDSLTLVVPEAIAVLKKFTSMPEGPGAAAVMGCFDDRGNFTPSPLKPVQ